MMQHQFIISNIISKYFYCKFFKCVLSSYLKQKISLQQAQAYLSSTFINYENMNEHELRKCIYLLKTKLKRHNSSRLLFDLIKIFLENWVVSFSNVFTTAHLQFFFIFCKANNNNLNLPIQTKSHLNNNNISKKYKIEIR